MALRRAAFRGGQLANSGKTELPSDENEQASLAKLDDFDRAILQLVQEDNQRTHAEIGERVNLSSSSVRRRLARMRTDGTIRADVAILDPTVAGVTVIVMVTFAQESLESVRAFRQRMVEAPEVAQCYSVAGSVDYVLVVHASSLTRYEAWSEQALMDDPAIRRYDTHIVWSEIKFTTAIPIASP